MATGWGEKYCQEERSEGRHESWVDLRQQIRRGPGVGREVPKGRAAEVPTAQGSSGRGRLALPRGGWYQLEETAGGVWHPTCSFTICEPLYPQSAAASPQSPWAHPNRMCSWRTHVTCYTSMFSSTKNGNKRTYLLQSVARVNGIMCTRPRGQSLAHRSSWWMTVETVLLVSWTWTSVWFTYTNPESSPVSGTHIFPHFCKTLFSRLLSQWTSSSLQSAPARGMLLPTTEHRGYAVSPRPGRFPSPVCQVRRLCFFVWWQPFSHPLLCSPGTSTAICSRCWAICVVLLSMKNISPMLIDLWKSCCFQACQPITDI